MYTFVTSFSEEGYNSYAKEMLQSVAEKWNPKNFKLVAYYHDFDIHASNPLLLDSITYNEIAKLAKQLLDDQYFESVSYLSE